MLILGIILFIIGISCLIYALITIQHTHFINKEVDKRNQELEKINQEFEKINKNNFKIYNDLKKDVATQKEKLENLQQATEIASESQINLSKKAFENYCTILEQKYKEEEEEYDTYINNLKTSYSNLQSQLMSETKEIKEDLNKIKATRAAAIQAQIREKQIEESLSFYCLNITDAELRDIAVLESIKPKLINPRILSMLIWQTYWQKPLNKLIADVVGTNVKTGIYKITNIKTKECYIGQAVSISDRFKQHCKCACGVDTPAGNKLYKAMQEYGIWNFSWEVLEEVPSAQLNEKEKYYIELYDSKNFGYNLNKGVQ